MRSQKKDVVSSNFLTRMLYRQRDNEQLSNKNSSENMELIIDEKGAVRMNYANRKVQEDITNKMRSFSQINLKNH